MLQDASKSSTEPEELELASNYPCRGRLCKFEKNSLRRGGRAPGVMSPSLLTGSAELQLACLRKTKLAVNAVIQSRPLRT